MLNYSNLLTTGTEYFRMCRSKMGGVVGEFFEKRNRWCATSGDKDENPEKWSTKEKDFTMKV